MEKLNSTAIEQLISRYKQELEKLRFQTMKTNDTINELKEGLQIAKNREVAVLQEMREKQQGTEAEAPAKAAKPKKAQKAKSSAKQEDPAKSSAEQEDKAKATTEAPAPKKTAKGKSRRTPKKAKKTRSASNDRSTGYRLSPVDELVIEALETREMALKTAELHEYAAEALSKKGESMDDDRLRLLISRSLQKLANRRDDIVKLRNPDERGHLYALPSWVIGSGEEANLKRKFLRK